jgi:hypothetical protein
VVGSEQAFWRETLRWLRLFERHNSREGATGHVWSVACGPRLDKRVTVFGATDAGSCTRRSQRPAQGRGP